MLGGNGAGKTTLLKIISGQLKPDKGYVAIDGKTITGLKPSAVRRLGICLAPQTPSLFEDMKVGDMLELAGVGTDVLSDLGIKEYHGVVGSKLPLGVKKLVNIALCASRNLKVLLLDEPFSGLEEREREKLFLFLKSLGAQLIVVEHRPRTLLGVVDRVVVIENGSVKYSGWLREVLKE